LDDGFYKSYGGSAAGGGAMKGGQHSGIAAKTSVEEQVHSTETYTGQRYCGALHL
jgi:hypothetical protein